MAHIILASSSPRRQELLTQLGLVFESYSPDIDESVQPLETVAQYVERLAQEKAQVVVTQHPDAIVIAADTSLGCFFIAMSWPLLTCVEYAKYLYVLGKDAVHHYIIRPNDDFSRIRIPS